MPASNPEAELRAYVASRLAPEAVQRLTDDSDLFQLLDSMDVIRIVGVLEDRFGVVFEDFELVPEKLGTIRRMIASARSKLGSPAA
ncbi:MAG: acyl carrier protein [Planctomycetaceae bacterium]|nr:acyl carrier protein [Planctomycetaceae bacterium]